MSKILTFVIVCALSACTVLTAQTYNFTWAKPIKTGNMVENMGKKAIITTDASSAYIEPNYFGNAMFKYHLKNKTITKTPFKLNTPVGSAEKDFVISMGSNIYFFMLAKNKNAKKHTLYVQTVNKQTMVLMGAPKKIMELSYEGESSLRPVSFGYALSPDESKLVIACFLAKKGEIIRSGFTVFDQDLKQLWKSNEVSTGLAANFRITHYTVDNDGKVYYCGGTIANSDDKKKVKKEFQSKTYVITMDENNREPNPIEIDFPSDKYGLNVILGVSPKNEVYCAGIYSKHGMASGLGIFAAKVDAQTGAIGNLSTEEFDLSFITSGLSDADKRKLTNKFNKGEDFENYSYHMDEITFLKNGTIVVSAAKRYLTILRTQNGGTLYISLGGHRFGKF